MAALARNARSNAGFTLVELLIVLAILGILLAIAVPSYLGFTHRATDATAKANLRAALPSVEGYFTDNKTYVGLTVSVLRTQYDQGLSPDVTVNDTADLTSTSYCLKSTDRGDTYWVHGPGGTITATKPSSGCT
jgi:prepilin-type N-terminal cleavage/methylation domain-containing protein